MTAIESRPTAKIIAAVERECEGADAVALAVRLARAMRAELVLTGVLVTGTGPSAHPYPHALTSMMNEILERVAAALPADVSATTRILTTTSVVHGLHELAERLDAALIVLGPTHVNAAGRAVHGDVTLGMLHAGPCPIAIAPDGLASAPRGAIETVGVAYVDSPEGREALEEAVAVARLCSSRLRLLHVMPAPASPWGLSPESQASTADSIREASATMLATACDTVADRVPCETLSLEGDPADALLAATSALDLLVLGSRGYGPSGRLLLGSVSARIVHEASCPVIVVPRGARMAAASRFRTSAA